MHGASASQISFDRTSWARADCPLVLKSMPENERCLKCARLLEDRVNLADDFTPRDSLRNSEFSPRRANERFPNAQKHLRRGLFISHSGVDSGRIREVIVWPMVYPRFGPDRFFFSSGGSGGGQRYRDLVQAALHWCDKFMVAITAASIANPWVLAEVEWAMGRSRPIIAVQFDQHRWNDLVEAIGSAQTTNPSICGKTIDFSDDVGLAQRQLDATLDRLLVDFPIPDGV
jgi:hypothetical protein